MAILTCKLRVKMHVGRLGAKWAAGLMKRPLAALENMCRPSSNMLKQHRASESEGHSGPQFAREMGVGLLGDCCGVGRNLW